MESNIQKLKSVLNTLDTRYGNFVIKYNKELLYIKKDIAMVFIDLMPLLENYKINISLHDDLLVVVILLDVSNYKLTFSKNRMSYSMSSKLKEFVTIHSQVEKNISLILGKVKVLYKKYQKLIIEEKVLDDEIKEVESQIKLLEI